MKHRLACLLLLLPSLALAGAPIDLPSYQFSYGEVMLVQPAAITLGRDSLIYVADAGSQQVQVFSTAGDAITSFPVGATPHGIAVAPDGTVWVTTSDAKDVRSFSAAGTPGIVIAPGIGDQPGVLWTPKAIACLDDGSVIVCCNGRDVTARFTPDGSFVREFKTSIYWGSNTGLFTNIHQFAVFSDSSLLCAVPYESEVRHYNLDGTLRSGFGLVLGGVYGVAVDRASERSWVTLSDRIEQFSAAGASEGSILQSPDTWSQPGLLTADRTGHLHVIVEGNRIARFGMNPVPAQTRSWGAVKAKYR